MWRFRNQLCDGRLHARRSKAAIATSAIAAFLLLALTLRAHAHPLVQNALDIVIEPARIVIDVRVSPEQIILVGGAGSGRPAAEQWPALIQKHASYVRDHLHVKADETALTAINATPTDSIVNAVPSALVGYRLEYPVSHPAHTVLLSQDFLREFDGWTASCVVRFRQSNQTTFETALLTTHKAAAFDCEWLQGTASGASAGSATSAPADRPTETTVRIGPTIRAYTQHGIMHILTGYDHLLFVSALVLAATGIWDLVKVVSAFTLAHTLTLTLSVFDIVRVSDRIVEPMIAASIVFVALQNVLWPEQSRGWTRLGVAFGFGLFHGLGFAGGLRDAMASMPSIAVWAALGAFSLGVELGHQVVVIPLYSLLYAAKHGKAEVPRLMLAIRVRQVCSVAICVAGVYFLAHAVR